MNITDRHADELAAVIQRISHERTLLRGFLEDVLSPAEHAKIVKRWQIVKQLWQGVSQRKIARNLRVSIATITRGSRELRDEAGGFQKVLKKLYPRRKL